MSKLYTTFNYVSVAFVLIIFNVVTTCVKVVWQLPFSPNNMEAYHLSLLFSSC